MKKALLSWGGGKDSALALKEIRMDKKYEIRAIIATLTEDYRRISMHGLREELLEKQAQSLNIPLEKVFISKDASNKEYESNMKNLLKRYQKEGVNSVIFGDIFLEDVRRYREDNLAKIGMSGVFPLWKRKTSELAKKFIDSGFKSIITCVDTRLLDAKFAGREFNNQFLADLPEGVDPCGENGEFHSFVHEGPIFEMPVELEIGERVLRDNRFQFCDLIPK